MKQISILVLLLIAAILVAGCTSIQNQTGNKTLGDGTIIKPDGTMIKPDGTMVKPDGTMILPNGTMIEPDKMQKNGTMMEKNGTMISKDFSGTVLAGSSSPLIDFNKADYEKAIKSDKVVVLYFYANWCPICRQEVPELYGAFNGLQSDKVIGFRVNFNDDQTDSNEVDLARQFGVPYQHTKIFVRNGQGILKSSESWNKERYLSEINKALG